MPALYPYSVTTENFRKPLSDIDLILLFKIKFHCTVYWTSADIYLSQPLAPKAMIDNMIQSCRVNFQKQLYDQTRCVADEFQIVYHTTCTLVPFAPRLTQRLVRMRNTHNSEQSDSLISVNLILRITSRNNAPISNYGGGFRCKSEYPWCIMEGHNMANKQLLTTVLNTDAYLLIAIQISGVFMLEVGGNKGICS
ncbi:hypothetical protein AGLY_011090 [Aphis glycines]|uniref:Uncharacterized protein n=1 Tax=Aphis glycines TaxID=307491 RepID=A0A6G0TD25_APHGL|nr:hypothetical protein AGLY_011090 [Aphis glycines]